MNRPHPTLSSHCCWPPLELWPLDTCPVMRGQCGDCYNGRVRRIIRIRTGGTRYWDLCSGRWVRWCWCCSELWKEAETCRSKIEWKSQQVAGFLLYIGQVATSLWTGKVWASIPEPVASYTESPTTRHRCALSSELCCQGLRSMTSQSDDWTYLVIAFVPRVWQPSGRGPLAQHNGGQGTRWLGREVTHQDSPDVWFVIYVINHHWTGAVDEQHDRNVASWKIKKCWTPSSHSSIYQRHDLWRSQSQEIGGGQNDVTVWWRHVRKISKPACNRALCALGLS